MNGPVNGSQVGGWELLAALPTAFLVTSERGDILFANERARTDLEMPHAMAAGTTVEDVLGPVLSRLPRTGSDSVDLTTSPPARPDRVFGLRVSRAVAQDGVERFLIVFRDITAIVQLSEERDRLLRLAAVGEILPAILHEIKNPLAAVSTSVEVLLEEISGGFSHRELSAVLSEVRRIKLTLEGVGLFRGELHARRLAPVDIALREAFLVLEPQIAAKGVRGTLRVHELPRLPFDPGALRAILFNLVTNAIHASQAGGQILVEAAVHGSTVLELRISDTGAGMSAEVLARCRELFFTTKPNGSGIGLALCQSVVEKAGGQLQIESAPGRGTTVTVRVPFDAPQRRTEALAAALKAAGELSKPL